MLSHSCPFEMVLFGTTPPGGQNGTLSFNSFQPRFSVRTIFQFGSSVRGSVFLLRLGPWPLGLMQGVDVFPLAGTIEI